MMFSIVTSALSNSDTYFKVEYGDEDIDFTISSLISTRKKEELTNEIQFRLLNGYVDWKGDEYKHKLFNLYKKAFDEITSFIRKESIHPLPTYIFNPIMDYFDLADIFHYCKHVYKLPPPSGLMVEFDEMIEKDGKGTRVQTYLKDDYLELVSLCLIIKAIFGPIGEFAHIKPKDIEGIHKEYILFHFIKFNKIFKSEPMQKLLGLIEKLLDLPTNPVDTDAVRIIEKRLQKDEIPIYILAVVALQRLTILPIVDDTDSSHIVTKIYNYVNSKLKCPGDISKKINNKTTFIDLDSGNGDTESSIESTRIVETLSTSTIIEINWAVDNIEKIIKQMPNCYKTHIDRNIVNDAVGFVKVLKNNVPIRAQLDICSVIFKDIIDPRAFDYLDLDNILNLLAVGFSYLWEIDQKQLALLLIAEQIENVDNMLNINLTTNRTRIPKEVKDGLEKYFPYYKVINESKTVNLVESTIGILTNELYSYRWNYTASDEYILQVYEDNNPSRILSNDLKLILAYFYIKHEELRYT